jgi:hypothetical protein
MKRLDPHVAADAYAVAIDATDVRRASDTP